MKQLIKTFVSCLPLFCAIVCIYGIVYLAIQQYIRLSANNIPMQYATETKTRLENGVALAKAIRGVDSNDMKKSLAPFVMICDNNGQLRCSTSTLNGHIVVPPAGVFAVAKQNGENRRTWQPEPGVRNAIVILPYSINGEQGYVIGGHSLREAEDRERFLLGQIAFGILATLLATFVTAIISGFIKNRIIPVA